MLRTFGRVLAAAFLLIAGAGVAQAQTIPLSGGTYSQNFDTLSNTAGSTTNTALPSGWLLTEAGGGARDNEQYAVDTGSSNTGDTFSYGSAGSTERAFGSLRSGTLISTIGACFNNATGNTLTSVDIAYTGEHWRLGTAARIDRTDFQYSLDATSLTTGTWVDENTLDFVTPNTTGTAGARDGNAAGNRTALSTTIGSLAIANGATFCIRWTDSDASGADDGLAADDFSITVGGTPTPGLSINDVSLLEGNAGTTTATFTVSLSSPAGAGGVSFDIATADGTATAGSDYVANALIGQTIAAGNSSASFSVTINGDTTAEANETFFANITNIVGALAGDAQGLGTIQNDDVTVVSIAQIQGNGLTSPLNGAVVTTEGIVTAQKFNNGFFLQTDDASIDADPNTSEGIFVFTSTAPPATAAVGNRIRISGTITEFTPSTNLNQLSITEIVSVTSIQVLSTGNPLPTPVVLTNADFRATSTPGSGEKFEGMRVSATSAIAITGSDGNITESSANATTTGVFQIVLNEVNRPFREAGIDILDQFPIPGGKTPPRFDHNPERIMVRSRGQIGATAVAIDADTTIDSIVGVMDYFSGVWAILPDAGALTISGGRPPLAVSGERYEDITVGGFNLLRFFDEVNDSNGGPTLTAAALDKRLTKTSLAICDYLRTPDILGVVEVENLRVLGLLADRINATCINAPAYVPYLVQGNDVGGINVGFLVSNRSLGLTNRVEVLEVTQFGKTTVLNNPDGSTSLLNDRPPLLLRAIVHQHNGATYPITVIINHLRSLNGVGDAGPGSNGWPTENARVSAKRSQQAVFLANLVHARQLADPNERIVLLGDFNAFEFNDGYADVMGIIEGTPAPEAEVITYAASPITTPLINGSEFILDPTQRYSYVFDGNAQTLDHAVVNEAFVLSASDIEVEHARINADFSEHHFGVAGTPLRVSDHDPVRLRISVPAFRSADLRAAATVNFDPARLDETVTFMATINNDGPSVAQSASVALVFDALVTPSLVVSDDWTCAAPVQNAGSTTITCTTPLFDSIETATFQASILIDLALANRSIRMDVATTSLVTDPANANNQASATVQTLANADLLVLASASAPTVDVNQTVNFTVDVSNSGPDAGKFASVAMVFDTLVAPVVTAPIDWTCAAPVQDASTTTVTCTTPSFRGAAANFGISVGTSSPQQADWTLRLAAAVTSQTPDDNQANNTAIATVQVRVFTDLDVSLNTSTPSVSAGGTASFTALLHNNGPATIATAMGTFTFDAVVSPVIVAPAGWTCGAPTQTATSTTVVCTAADLAPQDPSRRQFDVSFVADPALGSRTVTLTAAMSSSVADSFPGNNQVSRSIAIRGRADLAVTAAAITPSVRVGDTATLSANVVNNGPDASNQPLVRFSFSTPVTPTVTAPVGWTCAPVNGNIDCTTASLATGASAQFQASFVAGAAQVGTSVQMAVRTETNDDPNSSDNLAIASVAVTAAVNADLSLRMVGGSFGFIRSGSTALFSVPVRNTGPNAVSDAIVTFTGTIPLANANVIAPAGWTCPRSATAGGFSIVCTHSGTFAVGARHTFTFSGVAPSHLVQSSMSMTSRVSSTTTSDPVPGNNAAVYSVNIVAP